MGKYDDLIGGGKIVIDVNDILDEHKKTDILEDVYLRVNQLVEAGVRVLPTAILPSWEIITNWYEASDSISHTDDHYMYNAFYCAAEEYDKARRIGINNAFSSVICELGVLHQSKEWYEIMSYHYARQAERVDLLNQ